MSLIRNPLNGENPGSSHAILLDAMRGRSRRPCADLALCRRAIACRAFIYLRIAGRRLPQISHGAGIMHGKAEAMTGIAANADKVLSWKDLATAMPDPAIVLDRSSVILNYNAAAQSLFDRLRSGTTSRTRQSRSGAYSRRLQRFVKRRETHRPPRTARRRRPTPHRDGNAVWRRRSSLACSNPDHNS